jgi:hypothetical protein
MDYARRLLKGKKYSQDELIPFLVLIIHSFGGTAIKSDVDKKMYDLLSSEFSQDVYHQTVSHNVERWKHDIAWAKERARQIHSYVKSGVSPRFIFPIQSHLKFPVKEVGLEL